MFTSIKPIVPQNTNYFLHLLIMDDFGWFHGFCYFHIVLFIVYMCASYRYIWKRIQAGDRWLSIGYMYVCYFFILYRFIMQFLLVYRWGQLYVLVMGGGIVVYQWISSQWMLVYCIPWGIYLGILLVGSMQRTMKRSKELEFIDLGPEVADYDEETYEDNLYDMNFLSEKSGSNFGLLNDGFKRLVSDDQSFSVLDVGSGGGWIVQLLAKNYPNAIVEGIDTNPDAIAFSRSICRSIKNARFVRESEPELNRESNSYDIVTCNLMCHHIPERKDLITFLRKAYDVCSVGIVINDLERDPMQHLVFDLIVRRMRSNRLTLHDGRLSIERAYTESEWKSIIQEAGLWAQTVILPIPFGRLLIVVTKKVHE